MMMSLYTLSVILYVYGFNALNTCPGRSCCPLVSGISSPYRPNIQSGRRLFQHCKLLNNNLKKKGGKGNTLTTAMLKDPEGPIRRRDMQHSTILKRESEDPFFN